MEDGKDNYIPSTAITPESSKKDIKWLQERLNIVLPQLYPKIKNIIPLKVDGDYGAKTRIAVLLYWDALGWGKHMNDDGKKSRKINNRGSCNRSDKISNIKGGQ